MLKLLKVDGVSEHESVDTLDQREGLYTKFHRFDKDILLVLFLRNFSEFSEFFFSKLKNIFLKFFIFLNVCFFDISRIFEELS